MYSHFSEDEGADAEKADGEDPEVGRRIKMLPEPYFFVNRTPVAVDDIDQRVEFKEHFHVICFQHRDIPQDRGRPHTDLQSNIDDLLQIPDKDYQRAGQIAHAKRQQEHAEAVIKQL